MSDDAVPALRRDAERNRQRLLVAARELFARRGLGVTLNEIARHAGVGVGTAYRRFANKGEVVDALFETQIDEMAVIVDRALAEPDPWDGLVVYLEEGLALQVRDRGLAHILSGEWGTDEQHDRSRDRLAEKVDAITDRARQAGVLRDDVRGTDLIFMQVALNAVFDRTRDLSAQFYRRPLAILLDGLRAQPGRPSALPLPALTVAQTHELVRPRATTTGAAPTTTGDGPTAPSDRACSARPTAGTPKSTT